MFHQLYKIRQLIVYLNLITAICLPSAVLTIIFDEISTLHVWITISSLANRDPNNAKGLLFRQVEINWINAPLEEDNDYIGLYLDSQPDDGALPVSVHRLNGQSSGHIITDYYLPLIDFYNETTTTTQTISSMAERQQRYYNQRALEVPTMHLDQRDGIILPTTSGSSALRTRYSDNGGGYKSPSLESYQIGATLNEGGECIGYCIAYHSRNKILAKNCFQTNPNWMRDSFKYIGTRPLPSLMIPGSHNSGTYPKQLDKTVLHMINKYQMNQDESIFNQLIFGIRYLDLRIGYSKVKQRFERLWIYHDIFRTEISADEVFDQVKRFLDLTSHEIIIMDFHRFTVGFQNENLSTQRERHAKLIDLIFEKLGKYIIPSYLGQHAPLNEYVSMGKRLMVCYANRASIMPANQAEHFQSIYGHLQATGDSGGNILVNVNNSHMQQVRDIDAIKQDQDQDSSSSSSGLNYDYNSTAAAAAAAGIGIGTGSGYESEEQERAEQQQIGRRSVGTRLYNKLKSLKLVSKSFSKRSAINGGGSSSSEQTKQLKRQFHSSSPALSVTPQSAETAKLISSPSSSSSFSYGNDDEPPIISASLQQTSANVETNNAALDDALSVSRAALFFPPVKHLWPNKDTSEGLAQYMNETTCRKYFGELSSMMVEMTPTVFGAIADKYDGNRKLAQQVNRNVSDWIRERWLHCINIVASDFFLGNDLIRLSIYANKMRVLHRNVDLNGSNGQCKTFRKVEHLLDKSKIPIQFVYHHHHHHQQQQQQQTQQQDSSFAPISGGALGSSSSSNNKRITNNNDNDIIRHTSSDGNQIFLKPMTSSFFNGQAFIPREKRDSFVENVSDGFSNFFSSFKRLLNL